MKKSLIAFALIFSIIFISGISGCSNVAETKNVQSAPYSHDFSKELAPEAGKINYTYYVSPKTPLPTGLVLGADGRLHGTLTEKSGDIKICAKDASNNINCETIQLDVQDHIVQESQDVPTVDVSYDYDFSDEYDLSDELVPGAGQPRYLTYYVSPETPLPAGLVLLGTNGLLIGTPTVPGPSNFQICAKDPDNNHKCKTVKFYVQDNTPWKIQSDATIGVPLDHDFSNVMRPLLEAQGGDCHFPCTYYLGSGVGFPPFGLFLDSFTGQLKGTPSTTNGGTFQVCIKDIGGKFVCRIVTMDVNPAVPVKTITTLPGKTLWEGTLKYTDYSDIGSVEDSATCKSEANIRICMTRTGQNVEATYELSDYHEVSRVINGYGSCMELSVSGEDTSFSGQLDSAGNLNVEWFSLKGSVYKSSSNPDDNHQITASIIGDTMNFKMSYKSVLHSTYGKILQTEQKDTTITATKVADTC